MEMDEYSDVVYALDEVGLDREDVQEVIHEWSESPEGWGSVEIQLVVRLKDGTFAYFEAWCDTTGWGCQQGGTEVVYATSVAELIPDMTIDARRHFGYEPTPDCGV